MLKQNIGNLLSTEIDRKGFIKHVGLVIVALVGVGTVVEALIGSKSGINVGQKGSSFGYGDMTYGGRQ